MHRSCFILQRPFGVSSLCAALAGTLRRTVALGVCLLALGLSHASAGEETALFAEDFQSMEPGAALNKAWKARGNFAVKSEGAARWLELSGNGSLNIDIPLEKDMAVLRVSGRFRAEGVVAGKEGWQNGRVAMEFLDASGKHTGPWLRVPNATGTADWSPFAVNCPVPENAVRLRISPSNFGTAGTVGFDDLRVACTKRRQPLQDEPAPEGFTADPSLQRAQRERSSTQERICLNSLWQFLPAQEGATAVPAAGAGWGWFKIPGIWPTKGGYKVPNTEQEIIIGNAVEEKTDLQNISEAWYKRELTVPADWTNRSIHLDFSLLQSYAKVFVDGKEAGETLFPGGRVDLSAHLKAGKTQELAILVKARPLAKNRTVFMAPGRSFVEEGTLKLRGITGDLYLTSAPRATSLRDIRIRCSTRNKTITFDLPADALAGAAQLEAGVTFCGSTASGGAPAAKQPTRTLGNADLSGRQAKDGRITIELPWADALLWDTDTPQNQYLAHLTLKDAAGKVVDESLPVRFAFREFRIEGRDFYLNDKRIHLRALVVENMNLGAGLADYEACARTLRRLQAHGFNFFITDNYHFAPGGVGYMEGLLQAADDLGVLNAFSMPHVKEFEWKIDQPDALAAYRQLADALLQKVANHPSVAMFTMNHNATGYKGDQNPLRIDGKFDPDAPENGGSSQQRTQALIASNCVKALDPSRPVYHHQSGNLGDMYTLNIYLNWSPKQERSDWLEHWQQEGVKPVFFVEWGLPHVASWSSYRGPNFIWRTPALQQAWDAEFSAAYKGAAAYAPDERATKLLLQQQDLYAKGEPFRWSDLLGHLRGREFNYYDIQSFFAADNWRSHRARGLSAGLPWDQSGMWSVGKGSEVVIPKQERYRDLERPGIRPDRRSSDWNYLNTPDDASAQLTSLGKTFLRWNMPLCAFIGGAPGDFSEKSHNVRAGDTARKSLVIINDTRQPQTIAWQWNLVGTTMQGAGESAVAPGGRTDVPLTLDVPATLAAGRYTIKAVFRCGKDEQEDSFDLDVLAPAAASSTTTLARQPVLLDPEGCAGALLKRLGVAPRSITSLAELEASAYDKTLLILGRRALKVDTPLPGLAEQIRKGLHVLVLEQTEEVLVNRFGFRINNMGLREVFALQPGQPLMEGLENRHLRDWAGASTLREPYLSGADLDEPVWNWCGFENTRVWRCGNRGTVASVLMEKPESGNFTQLLAGGFDLQYAPVLDCAAGTGRVVFSQLDLCGRSANDPAADQLFMNLLRLAATPSSANSAQKKTIAYAGDAKGKDALAKLGFGVSDLKTPADATPSTLVVLAPGYDKAIDAPALRKRGISVLALGLNAADTTRAAGASVVCKGGPVLPTVPAEAAFTQSLLTGVSPADLYWRGRLNLAGIESCAEANAGNEGLRVLPGENGMAPLVLLQAAPWNFEQENSEYFRKPQRRVWHLLGQLLRNLGAVADSPLPENLEQPGRITQISLAGGWLGIPDVEKRGRDGKWFEPSYRPEGWRATRVPAMFDQQFADLKDYDGLFWYRKEFTVPESADGEGLTLYLGVIDDESWVWLNGTFLGEVTKETNPKDHYSVPRAYQLKKGALKPGSVNQLTILVNDLRGKGGIRGTPVLRAPGKWLSSYYVMPPKAEDDPYRYYRW